MRRLRDRLHRRIHRDCLPKYGSKWAGRITFTPALTVSTTGDLVASINRHLRDKGKPPLT